MLAQNFKMLIKKHKLLLLFIALCQALFMIVILFIIGVYYNNEYEKEAIMENGTTISVYVGKESDKIQYVKTEQITDDFMPIFSSYENIVDEFIVFGKAKCDEGWMSLVSRFGINDELYTAIDSKLDIYAEGRFFNDADMNSGEKICIIPMMYADNHHENIKIRDVEYKVIAYQNKEIDEKAQIGWGDRCFIPFKSLGEEEKVYEILIILKRPLMDNEYNDIKNKVAMYWGNKVKMSEYVPQDFDDNGVRSTINYAIVLIGVLAAITMCAFYYFITIKRMKIYAVDILCGCSVSKLIVFSIIEMILCLSINSIIGGAIYYSFLYEKLAEKYLWFSIVYGGNVVALKIITYLLIIAVVCSIFISFILRKEPVKILRLAKKL